MPTKPWVLQVGPLPDPVVDLLRQHFTLVSSIGDGVLGLGTIGSEIARRAKVLGMDVGYHNRTPRPEASERHFLSLPELARWSRFLVVCCPGGPATQRLINSEVLSALGGDSWLVNVARGSVVDEHALDIALEQGWIAGAGLDVFEEEPRPLPVLLARDNVVLLPHIGSATIETREAMAKSMGDALVRALGSS